LSDVIEKRVTDIETLVWDIPNLLNLRFTRFETEVASLRGAIADNTSRVASVERAMAAMQIDMRDLRGGVTRQLVEQDRVLNAMGTSLKEQDGVLATMGTSLKEQDRVLDVIVKKLDDILQRLPKA
jgi:uncharacterized coiled-coil protein SlyX